MPGYSFKRARLSIKHLRDEEQFDKQQSEIIELIELYKQGYLDLYFGYESHFGLTPNLPYAWQHKDKPLLLPACRSKSLEIYKYQWIPLDAYRNFQNFKDRLNETLLLVGSKYIIKYY